MDTYSCIGIDPGASGGIVAITDTGTVCTYRMPRTEEGIIDTLWQFGPLSGRYKKSIAIIEKVSGYIRPRKKIGSTETEKERYGGDTGSTMFKFGQNYGALRMALVASGYTEDVSFYALPPRTWLTLLGLHRGTSESKTSWKNRLKDLAKQYFSDLTLTLKTADASLLAYLALQVGRGFITLGKCQQRAS